MDINGVYRYNQTNNPYDMGDLLIKAKETEKSITLQIMEDKMLYTTYVDVLFKGNNRVTIRKYKSNHAINRGDDYFVIYPDRSGVPLLFEKNVD